MSRILFVVDSPFPLADAFPLRTLAAALPKEHQGCICVTGESDDQSRAAFRWTDIPVHFLAGNDKLKQRGVAAQIQSSMRLRKRIRSFQPDFVHAFGQTGTSIAATALTRKSSVGLISTITSKWRPQTSLMAGLERRLVRRVDRFVLPHESLKPGLLAMGVAAEKMESVTFGIGSHPNEANEADPQQRRQDLIAATGIPSSAFIAVTSAELEPVTRLKDLIWATDLLTCVRDDVHLVIFGQGSQQQRLLDFADCTIAASHVHFAGEPTNASQLICGADVFWNSHLQSPLSGGLLTAMNASLPVISVYGPETSQLIKHQETGFAVNYGARDEFARWTKFLIEKKTAGQQLANQGQQHVQENFSAEQMVDQTEAIWKRGGAGS